MTRQIKRGYCEKHYQQVMHTGHLLQPVDREKVFWTRVTIGELDDCWPWKNACLKDGYGASRDRNGKMGRAHRIAYEYAVGPIPAGKLLDHLCHDPRVCTLGFQCPHRRCCNPRHLKPVTSLENSAPDRAVRDRSLRSTHCARGHEYTPENTRTDIRGGRHCRECDRTRRR